MAIDRFRGEYEFLSNFYPSEIVLHDLIVYPTVEHAFQAHKTFNTTTRKSIASAETPGDAKKLGRILVLRPDWEEVKLVIMEECLYDKFTRYNDLRDKLLATGDEELIEGNTWGDRFWGVCNGSGENHLGKLLMRLREKLRP